MSDSYLFVYGTLMQKSGHAMHEKLKRHCEFICEAWMTGELYQIRYYPGVIESESVIDRVYGEVYRLTEPRVLAELDDFEECSAAFPEPHEYLRKEITVFITDNKTLTAWAYIYNHPLDKSKRISSGRFI